MLNDSQVWPMICRWKTVWIDMTSYNWGGWGRFVIRQLLSVSGIPHYSQHFLLHVPMQAFSSVESIHQSPATCWVISWRETWNYFREILSGSIDFCVRVQNLTQTIDCRRRRQSPWKSITRLPVCSAKAKTSIVCMIGISDRAVVNRNFNARRKFAVKMQWKVTKNCQVLLRLLFDSKLMPVHRGWH